MTRAPRSIVCRARRMTSPRALVALGLLGVASLATTIACIGCAQDAQKDAAKPESGLAPVSTSTHLYTIEPLSSAAATAGQPALNGPGYIEGDDARRFRLQKESELRTGFKVENLADQPAPGRPAGPPPSPASDIGQGGGGAGAGSSGAPSSFRDLDSSLSIKGTKGIGPDEVGRPLDQNRTLHARAEEIREAQPFAASRSLRGLLSHPGTLPALAEEVWVIQRYCPPPNQAPDQPQPGSDTPGTGSMITTQPDPANPGATTHIPIPLAHTDVHASITGLIASVAVTQQFHNPFNSKIEAVYVFPLPENAAVSEFVMTVGDRTIRGIIRDREEARAIYDQAKAQGYTAALLEQSRPNIFTQSVANIEPGKRIDVAITYFNTLPYVDGAFEFAFPMVVGPRYNSAGTYDGIGAAPRNAHPNATGQATQVSYLKPGERTGHDIAITVDINAGVPIERVTSDSHVASVTMGEPVFTGGRSRPPSVLSAKVTLSKRDAIPNKDFVLRIHVAGDALRSGIITGTDRDGTNYFSLLVVPPNSTASINRAPVELVFVLDASGSMNGWPIRQAAAAIERGLKRLDAGDTFQIINFAHSASQLGPAPLPATDANIARGIDYLRAIQGQGGTEMLSGLRAALDFPHDPKRLRFVCFLTDGFIGSEAQILGELHARLRDSRIFSFGVGTSVNRYLIDAMGTVGRGCVAHVAAGDSPDQIMDRFFDRISRPALTHVNIDYGNLQVEEVYPRQLNDVFVGRAMVVHGRLRKGASLDDAVVTIRGNSGGKPASLEVPFTARGIVAPQAHPALAKVWARAKLADIADHAAPGAVAESVGQIREVALGHGLMSAFTSFVAVDSLAPTAGAFGTTVAVPVPVPDGVRYQTTVPQR